MTAWPYTPAISKIIIVKYGLAWVSIWVSYLEKEMKIKVLRICLLKSTANPAQFGWKLAGLAVLFQYLAGKSQTARRIFFSF